MPSKATFYFAVPAHALLVSQWSFCSVLLRMGVLASLLAKQRDCAEPQGNFSEISIVFLIKSMSKNVVALVEQINDYL